ncbi:MAG: hypothetical protein ABIA59_08020, partial [Candidatus Latescibacterota bacterium]
MSHLKKIVLSVALLACLLGCRLSAFGALPVKSNLDVLTELASGVAEELIANFQSRMGNASGVLLLPHAKDETYEFLVNIFMKELTASGIKTYSSNPPASDDVPPSTG